MDNFYKLQIANCLFDGNSKPLSVEQSHGQSQMHDAWCRPEDEAGLMWVFIGTWRTRCRSHAPLNCPGY